MERTRERPIKPPAQYLVTLVRTVPEPAPKRASVAPPPNARPMPASFFGSWIRMSRIRKRLTTIRTKVRNPISRLMGEGARLDGVLDDIAEAAFFEGGAADEGAVDVREGHEFAGVGGFDASAVLDADAAGGGFVVEFGEQAADEGMGVLGLLGGGGFAGADGPDGFVGDDRFDQLLLGEAGEAAADLGLEDGLGLAGFAFGEGFTDADDGFEGGGVGGEGLAGDEGVGLFLVLAAFGVAEDDVADGEFLEHDGGDFSGVGADPVFAHVLGPEADVAVEDGLGDSGEGGEGGADDDIDFLDGGEFAFEAADEVEGLGGGFVHLPIAGDDQLAFFVHRKGLG